MTPYILFMTKSFTSQLAYRSDVWLRLLGNYFAILIQVEIWRSVIGKGESFGVTIDQMITYSILNTLLVALLLHGISGKVDGSLKSGSIAVELIKPLSYPLYLLFDALGQTLYKFVFTVIPSLLIAWLLFGMLPPASTVSLVGFVAALLIAMLISFLLGYLVSLLAFWFMSHFALSWTLGGMITIFSGSFLPIWFYAPGWEFAARMLPFQYLGYVPAAIYLGNMSHAMLWQTLLIGLAWTIGLLAIVQWLWSRAVRRLIVQGG
ncbi:daunorubicin ABC transporter permease [Paenibacillus sp. CCS19]|uniref:ABC transporter permease n=1 Tax=Paenibacillus sp. CCS19 TaxID=3158387 RepID=UPI002564F0F3|nr:ABC-2 family transporter protein [Paenibacillus cellulosilyticus]GMK37640.1 daunorubicin ABC transporter permease [Paenibacillus cellulosilyticus]